MIIVAFLKNATTESVCVSVHVRVCVFLHDNSSKSSVSRNTKLEHIVVYENSSELLKSVKN